MMKKRPILSILLLDIVTLGLYELYWLARTRREMATKFRLKVPHVAWLAAVKAIQIGCIVFVAYVVLFAMPANNRQIDTTVRPSAECFYSYTRSNDAVRTGGKATVSQKCKDQIEQYYTPADNTANLLLAILGLYVLAFVVSWLVLRRWFVPYAEAVAKVTKQHLTATQAMILLTAAPSPLGMLAIQRVFNTL